jgi:hypothetical protein
MRARRPKTEAEMRAMCAELGIGFHVVRREPTPHRPAGPTRTARPPRSTLGPRTSSGQRRTRSASTAASSGDDGSGPPGEPPPPAEPHGRGDEQDSGHTPHVGQTRRRSDLRHVSEFLGPVLERLVRELQAARFGAFWRRLAGRRRRTGLGRSVDGGVHR